MARDGEPLDPRMLRVPDAPAWEPERANGYHSENGRTRH
jgi:hypothetical protein